MKITLTATLVCPDHRSGDVYEAVLATIRQYDANASLNMAADYYAVSDTIQGLQKLEGKQGCPPGAFEDISPQLAASIRRALCSEPPPARTLNGLKVERRADGMLLISTEDVPQLLVTAEEYRELDERAPGILPPLEDVPA
jgi:hypothetical protein